MMMMINNNNKIVIIVIIVITMGVCVCVSTRWPHKWLGGLVRLLVGLAGQAGRSPRLRSRHGWD